MTRPGFVVIVLLRFGLLPATAEDRFEFSLGGPNSVDGIRGADVSFTLDVRIKTLALDIGSQGAEAWSMALECENCVFVGARLPDWLADVNADERPMGSGGPAFVSSVIEKVTAGGGATRMTHVLVIDDDQRKSLSPDSPHTILHLDLRTSMPGDCSEARVSFVDGIKLEAQPVDNHVVLGSRSVQPALVGKIVELVPAEGCGGGLPVSFFKYVVDAPQTVDGEPGTFVEFDAGVGLEVGSSLPNGVSGAEAWSIAFVLKGCEATAVSLAEAVRALDPDFCSICDAPMAVPARSAVVSVILDFDDPIRFLPPSPSPHGLLDLRVRGRIGGQCSACEIRFEDGVDGPGAPVDNVVVSGQRGYRPSLEGRIVQLGIAGGCEGRPGATPYIFSIDGAASPAEGGAVDLSVVIGTKREASAAETIPPPEGWSIALRVENATIAAAALPASLALDGDSYKVCSACDAPGGTELTDAVILGQHARDVLPGKGPWRVLDLRLAPVQQGGCSPVRVAFIDGVRTGGQPVRNLVTVGQVGFAPGLVEKTIVLRAPSVCRAVVLPIDETFRLSACDPTRCFRLTPPTGKPLLLESSSSSLAILARWGAEATVSRFDVRSTPRADGRQVLVIPASRASELWVTLASELPLTNSGSFVFRARVAELELTEVRPGIGALGGRVGLTIRGIGFEGFNEPKTKFTLEREGYRPIEPTAEFSAILSRNVAEMQFSLAEADLGKYHVVAADPDLGRRVLAEAVEVVTPQEAYGVDVAITGQDRFRKDRVHTIFIDYANVGVAEIDAPLVRIKAPRDSFLRLPGSADFGEQIILAATDARGFAGTLAPGMRGRIPVLLKSGLNQAPGEDAEFLVDILTPLASDRIIWIDEVRRLLPGAVNPQELAAALEKELGRTWTGYVARMAELATRLGRRGEATFDPARLLRFAARRGLGRPSAAVVGRALSSTDGAPLDGVLVVATAPGNVRPLSYAWTDASGSFVIDWLENGKKYVLRCSARDGEVTVQLPPGNRDLYAVELHASPGEVVGTPVFGAICGNCNEESLPGAPVKPDDNLNTPLLSWATTIVGSFDPNEKEGSKGKVPRNGVPQVPPKNEIKYTIYFENVRRAGAAVQDAVIIDDLDPGLDPSSVQFIDVVIHDQSLAFGEVPASSSVFFGEDQPGALGASGIIEVTNDCNNGANLSVRVAIEAQVELDTGRITWTLSAIDRHDGQPELVDCDGFLPSNDETHRGEGHVTFSARPRPNPPNGERVHNRASIKFDAEEPIFTHWVEHEVNYFLPAGRASLPIPADGAEVDPGATLGWQSEYGETFDVYYRRVSPPGVARTTHADSHRLRPLEDFEPGEWEWSVTARNILEMPTPGPTWRFTVREPSAQFKRGRVDEDDRVNITDPIRLLGYLFLGASELGCRDAGDANDDGVLNITDAIRLLNFLFLGNVPPPPPPFDECGVDPTDDSLDCVHSPSC